MNVKVMNPRSPRDVPTHHDVERMMGIAVVVRKVSLARERFRASEDAIPATSAEAALAHREGLIEIDDALRILLRWLDPHGVLSGEDVQ